MQALSICRRILSAAFVVLLVSTTSACAQVLDRATSQVVYVPSYSSILTQEGRSQPLASTLVVHNVDPDTTISVTRIDYYDRTGTLLRSFLGEAVPLEPFESSNALIPIDSAGDGIGANFVVEWSSSSLAIEPIIEAIMIGGSGTQGISFTSSGRVISQTP